MGITCLGTERGLETRLVPMRGYPLALIPAVPLPRRLTTQLLHVPGRLLRGERRPRACWTGTRRTCWSASAATWPRPAISRRGAVMCRSWCTRPTPGPGLANRIGARFTRNVFTGHPATRLPHARYVGIPLRQEIASLDRLALADKARAHFGLRPDLPVLLVTGGSQGARSLNYAVLDAAAAIRGAGVQVLHILGPRSEIDVRLPDTGAPYVMLPYIDRMDLAYAAADFAICRSGRDDLRGADRCRPARGLRAAAARQRRAAAELAADRGGRGGLIVADADLTPDWIRADLLPVLLDAQLVAAMSQAAAALGRRDADDQLAAEVIRVIRGRAGTHRAGTGRA